MNGNGEGALVQDSAAGAGRPVLEIEGLEQRLYDAQRVEGFLVYVPQRITIYPGDFVALLGPSGCGKTTLLTVLGLLRAPSNARTMARFSMWVEQADSYREYDLKAAWIQRRYRRIEHLRRRHLGFALQGGELLPALTVGENVAAPLRINGVTGRHARRRVDELLASFGLGGDCRREPAADAAAQAAADNPAAGDRAKPARDLSRTRVNKLSGGEYQRVSLARAIAHRPRLVFVDEPTAALNRELARGALAQLRLLQRQESRHGATIMVTHDEALAQEFANVVIRMAPRKDRPAGEVVEVIRPPRAEAAQAACSQGADTEQ
jgi:ABC-type lipoprotein export system ATPase subunit